MASENVMVVCGTATRDPELRYTSGGRGVANLGVAQNTRYKDDKGVWQDGAVSFFNVTVWGDLGEHVAECITKGTRVVVVGRMQQRSWETEDGEKRTVWDLVADDIGPSLKWATATVVKTNREKVDKPSASPHDPDYGDEEPF